METNYGSTCSGGGSPTLNDIVVNGVYCDQSSVSGAYSNLYGFSSGDPIVAYFANMQLDNNSHVHDDFLRPLRSTAPTT